VGFAAIAVLLGGGASRAADSKVPLLREVVVRGSSVYLADLLPERTPSSMRIPAQRILIGRAPQPGSIRVFSAEAVLRRLVNDDVFSEVEVPPQIVIHRSGRQITREEVAAAIQATLRHNKLLSNQLIAPEDIWLMAPVMLSVDDAQLQVTRMDLDPALHQIKFLLVSRADHSILPFVAMARSRVDLAQLDEAQDKAPGKAQDRAQDKAQDQAQDKTAGPAGRTGEETRSVETMTPASWIENLPAGLPVARFDTPAQQRVTLVEPGKLARLRLISGPSAQLSLDVTALEAGAIGQRIRVRLRPTGKILEAQVTGWRQVEANY
jgi:hypothetical protein